MCPSKRRVAWDSTSSVEAMPFAPPLPLPLPLRPPPLVNGVLPSPPSLASKRRVAWNVASSVDVAPFAPLLPLLLPLLLLLLPPLLTGVLPLLLPLLLLLLDVPPELPAAAACCSAAAAKGEGELPPPLPVVMIMVALPPVCWQSEHAMLRVYAPEAL